MTWQIDAALLPAFNLSVGRHHDWLVWFWVGPLYVTAYRCRKGTP